MSSEIKILLYIAFIITLFLIQSLLAYAVIFIVILLFMLRIPFTSIKKGWVPVSFFLAFTFLSNIFFSHGKILYSSGAIVITEEGLHIAAIRTLRIFFMVAGAKILTATTPLDVLIAGLGRILKPVERTGLNLNDFFETMGLTLKCFPRLKDYMAESYRNHKDRREGDGFFKKAKIIASFLMPMFIQSIQSPEMFFKEEKPKKAARI